MRGYAILLALTIAGCIQTASQSTNVSPLSPRVPDAAIYSTTSGEQVWAANLTEPRPNPSRQSAFEEIARYETVSWLESTGDVGIEDLERLD